MTKEEAIIILKQVISWRHDYLRVHPKMEYIAEAIEVMFPYPYISLPSNLDEAAEEYERNLGYYECMNQWPSVAFKAGAEWMAGQGVSMQITDDTEWEEVDSFIHKNVNGCSIIQIRKK